MAISPIDGRYASKTDDLRNYFSEYALMKYRLRVEINYYIALCEMPLPQLIKFPRKQIKDLQGLVKSFDLKEAERVKEIESETNHDVKAIEYYIKEKMDGMGLGEFCEFVHFGLTSQDVNNTANPLMFKEWMEEQFFGFFEEELLNEINTMGHEWNNISMLARTHGQPASPTTLGREFLVYYERLIQQYKLLRQIPFTCKFGGATGGMNAHYASYAAINWHQFANDFCLKGLGLERQRITTQIEHYDYQAAFFDNLKRINNILIDLCRDVWTYISMDYFGQRISKKEVGSSTMPHKVNPIDFENAEGNFMMANSLFDFLSSKLPVSRLQRDLTDSTVSRNIGLALAHSWLAFQSLKKGLSKLNLNPQEIRRDLNDNFVIVAEGIQSILRREGYPKPYEALKELTRKNKRPTRDDIHEFIDGLDVKDELKAELKELKPETYIGKGQKPSKLS